MVSQEVYCTAMPQYLQFIIHYPETDKGEMSTLNSNAFYGKHGKHNPKFPIEQELTAIFTRSRAYHRSALVTVMSQSPTKRISTVMGSLSSLNIIHSRRIIRLACLQIQSIRGRGDKYNIT